MSTATVQGAEPITRPIRSRREFLAAVFELDKLIDSNPPDRSASHDRMELLALLVGAYETEHVPKLDPATPQELVQFMAEQKGLTSADLADLLGGRPRLSEFLNGSRDLSKNQILRIRDALGIPADLLLRM